MARVGSNPLRNVILRDQPRLVVTAITHLPEMEGYHAERLQVVKLCLSSMKQHSPGAGIAIWDNGSCAELTDWLREEYKPDQLVLSGNVGKWAARSALLRMYHPDTVIGISDDDMLFYPGWIAASYEILRVYPNVGTVSGYPVRTQVRWGCENTIAWGKQHAQAERGRFIPDEYERDFCTSIGRDYAWHKQASLQDYDWRATYKGVSAYLTGHHCQFIAVGGRLQPFLDWSNKAMPDEKPFDRAIDAAGLLRLTTTTRYTRHIGNVIDKGIADAAKGMGLL